MNHRQEVIIWNKNTSYFTRMGDGSGIYMSAEEIRRDIEEGVSDAMKRGKIEGLSQGGKSTPL